MNNFKHYTGIFRMKYFLSLVDSFCQIERELKFNCLYVASVVFILILDGNVGK